MSWKQYAVVMLLFNGAGILLLYALQRFQHLLPFNPRGFPAVGPDSSLNTAISFVTNTNWQGYAGETTMSHFTQMAGLTVQNFVSAATGMAVLVALIRGFARRSMQTIGSFWVDLVRSVVYILLPLSLILALALVSQGAVQTFRGSVEVAPLQPTSGADGGQLRTQVLPLGPAASQVAIKQIGTNGGGFFNTNSAHPFENPTPFSNLLEMLAIFLIPGALCYTFGRMVRDTRQGWAILAAMTIVFLGFTIFATVQEQAGTPVLSRLGLDLSPSATQSGGNMEGKEVRFGVAASSLFTTVTTAASCGAVNAMHDSHTPLGGMAPMLLIQLGEVIYGGVGSGLYGMLAFAVIAVFLAGLMVGRTPEYLGKKIEAYEMKMASLMILVTPLIVLVGTAAALASAAGRATIYNPGAHGLSEVLYAYSSAANNNGSAFAGLGANTPFYNITLGIAMFLGRFWIAIPILALAGSLAGKKIVPVSAGTLPTHGPVFVILLIGSVLTVSALTYIPALTLGPIVEQIQMLGMR